MPVPTSAEPSARVDPEAYLCSRKFSSTLQCRRTGKRVSYADIGDPDGIPLLWLTPSGCSRWFAVPQDPLAKRYGIRVIAIDRPGVGATERVTLGERIATSCKMIASVLEYLDVKPRHILAHSAGVYHALYLLNHHLDIFDLTSQSASGSMAGPYVYFVAPWSPVLPTTHPDYYTQYLSLIPTKLIETQHVTLPHLIPALRTASTAWSQTTSALSNGWSFARSAVSSLTATAGPELGAAPAREQLIYDDLAPAESPITSHSQHQHPETAVPVPDVPTVDLEVPGPTSTRLWGDFPCCLDCTVQEYFHLEDIQGVGQEHLICLNRGEEDTGHIWFENAIAQLAQQTRQRRPTPRDGDPGSTSRNGTDERADDERLNIHVWWGSEDKMVPVQGQEWFSKAFRPHPDDINLTEHRVEDADHTDLLGRLDGIHQVYCLIQRREGRS